MLPSCKGQFTVRLPTPASPAGEENHNLCRRDYFANYGLIWQMALISPVRVEALLDGRFT